VTGNTSYRKYWAMWLQRVTTVVLQGHRFNNYVVSYTPISKRWLCKQCLLLGKVNNNRTIWLCNLFLSNGSVNTFPQKWTSTQ
jgi:hypothetical protein